MEKKFIKDLRFQVLNYLNTVLSKRNSHKTSSDSKDEDSINLMGLLRGKFFNIAKY
jgi:hypothetical protein